MHLRQTVFTLVVVSLLTTTAAVAVATPTAGLPSATDSPTEPTFGVHLHANGDADVAVTYAFDLETDAEQQAFRELRENQSARDAYAARFEDRLGVVAANAADRTDRDMCVGDATADVSADGATGTVTLQATWYGLAATDGDELVLTEPFASGFEPDRQFVVTLPDGYSAEVTPQADNQDDGRFTWAAGTDLSGFELTASGDAASDGSGEPSSAVGPGLGVAAGVGGLISGGLLAARRSH